MGSVHIGQVGGGGGNWVKWGVLALGRGGERGVHKQTQTFCWTTMKSGFAKIQTYDKHTHRHEWQ